VTRATWPRWVSWVPAGTWAVTLFVLSSRPWLTGPPGGLSDKHIHALAFGLLALACLFGLVHGQWRRVDLRWAVVAAVMASLYGVSDEWHQSFVPGRTADWADVRADAIGAVIAAGAGWAWAILLRRRTAARSPH